MQEAANHECREGHEASGAAVNTGMAAKEEGFFVSSVPFVVDPVVRVSSPS